MSIRIARRGWAMLGRFMAIVLASSTIAASDGRPDDPPAVATVAGDEIPADEFRSRYAQYLVRTGLADAPLVRARFLDHLIDDRLLALDSLASDVRATPQYRLAEELHRRKLLIDLFVRRSLYEPIVVTEADLEEAFVRMNTTLEARHLYARTLPEAERLHARILAGEPFEKLAAETFGDSALAASGGSLGTFSFDEMDAAFEDAAYALEVGEISEPVRTAQGYSIIELLARHPKPLLTKSEFAQRRNYLEIYVVNRKRAAARLAYARDLAASLDLAFDDQSLDDLMKQISGSFVAPDDEAFHAWLARPLLHFAQNGVRQTWTIGDFRTAAQFTDAVQRAQVRNVAELTEFARGVVVRQVMLDRAYAEGLDADTGFSQALQQTMADWLANDIRAQFLAQREDEKEAADALRSHLQALRERFEVRVSHATLSGVPLVGESNL